MATAELLPNVEQRESAAKAETHLEDLETVVKVMRQDAVEAVQMTNERSAAYVEAMARLGEHLPATAAAQVHELMTTKLQPAAARYDEVTAAMLTRIEPIPANNNNYESVIPQEVQMSPVEPEYMQPEPAKRDLDVKPATVTTKGPTIKLAA